MFSIPLPATLYGLATEFLTGSQPAKLDVKEDCTAVKASEGYVTSFTGKILAFKLFVGILILILILVLAFTSGTKLGDKIANKIKVAIGCLILVGVFPALFNTFVGSKC